MQRARSDKDKEIRKQQILDAALNTFFEHGFNAARMDDIAQQAGVSKGTLYLYFSSKDALFEGLINAIAKPNLKRMQDIVSSSSSVPEAIRAMFKIVPSILRTSNLPKLMKIIIGESNTFPHTVNAYRRTIIDPMLNTISTVLKTAHERGEITIADPMLTTRLLFAPIAFSGMWEIVFAQDPDAHVDLEALMDVHADMFIRAISHTGDTP